jgi:hypothetical protein
MRILNKRFTILAAQFVLLFGPGWLAAQQSPRPAFSTNAQAERIPNLDALKKELRQYHDCTCTCGCYAHDLDAQADQAIAFLRERVERRRAGEKLALILDIDETTLSNYMEISDADFQYIPDAFNAWIDTKQALVIPGTLRLYKEAQRLGVNILFITGRTEDQRTATEFNLRTQGFDHWQELVMRPTHYDASQTVGEFKKMARGQMVAKGYTLALNVGDQWSDLKGKPEAEFSVKYPDPFYFVP